MRQKQHKLTVSLTAEQKHEFVELAARKSKTPHALLKEIVLRIIALQPVR